MIREELRPHAFTLTTLLVIVTTLFVWQQNYEFLLYVGVLLALAAVILISDRHVKWRASTTWLLLIWGVLHMAGGAVPAGETVLYGKILIPILGEPWHILRYDHAIHAYGFFVATLATHQFLRPQLSKHTGTVTVGLVLFAAGSGWGAVNEIIEFLATVLFTQTGVGGYTNTLLDLCFNAIGASAAVGWLSYRDKL